MNKRTPNWLRGLISFFCFFTSIGVYSTVSKAGNNMMNFAKEMTQLYSKSGGSLAEHYYRLQGGVYLWLGSAISNIVGLVLVFGIAFSVWYAYPLFKKEKRDLREDN